MSEKKAKKVNLIMITIETVRLFERGVYVLDFSEYGKYFGIALVPRIRKIEDDEDLQNSEIQLCYFNGERGHMLSGKLKEATDNSCTFIWNAGEAEEQTITMRLMTMEEFDTRYRANIDPQGRFIHDMDDVTTFFYRQVPEADKAFIRHER